MAATIATTTGQSGQGEDCSRKTPASPLPVTIAIRAQVNCTAVIIGNVISAVHSVAKPNDAPATAYVPMPEGSSSDAPVIKPGPRTIKKRLNGFGLRDFFDDRPIARRP